jgi:hypothetical protein
MPNFWAAFSHGKVFAKLLAISHKLTLLSSSIGLSYNEIAIINGAVQVSISAEKLFVKLLSSIFGLKFI